MIEFLNISKQEPYNIFIGLYKNALSVGQKSIEAIAISSFNHKDSEVESRFVNLKYISGDEWIFFSNYNSNKAKNFFEHDQISALIYWNETDTQIRLKAKIKKTSQQFSDNHFNKRSFKKNALAASSDQSNKIETYEEVLKNYHQLLSKKSSSLKRPSFWGGFSFCPYYFEFWEGNKNRVNKRTVYESIKNNWHKYYLQP